MTNLKGSEKQVEWAEKIRKKAIARNVRAIAQSSRAPEEMGRRMLDMYKKIGREKMVELLKSKGGTEETFVQFEMQADWMDEIISWENETSAAYFIDRRDTF